jgi:tetratricopeptide (TPR) repeat protein
MKKLLIILFCFPFLFSCGGGNANSQNTDRFNEFINEVSKLNSDGSLEYKSQNFAEAINILTKAIEINESYNSDYAYGNIPLLAESYFLRASVKARLGYESLGYPTPSEYKDAINDYSKAIELGGLEHTQSFNQLPQKSAYCFRAMAKLNLNDFNGAILDCNKSIELFPTGDAYLYRSIANYQLGSLNEACSDAKEGLKIAEGWALEMCHKLSKQYCK